MHFGALSKFLPVAVLGTEATGFVGKIKKILLPRDAKEKIEMKLKVSTFDM
jgi:hypothetical protein